MDKVEDEENDSMYQDWLKYNEPGGEAATGLIGLAGLRRLWSTEKNQLFRFQCEGVA